MRLRNLGIGSKFRYESGIYEVVRNYPLITIVRYLGEENIGTIGIVMYPVNTMLLQGFDPNSKVEVGHLRELWLPVVNSLQARVGNDVYIVGQFDGKYYADTGMGYLELSDPVNFVKKMVVWEAK